MEKARSTQLELFSQAKETESRARQPMAPAFLSRIRNYEKTIFILIGFLITSAFAFCLGVEKGKKISVTKADTYFDVAQDEKSQAQPRQAKKEIAPKVIKETQNPPPQILDNSQNYTIQIASYKTRSFAQKEAQKLKDRGIPAAIFAKGSYTVLCVGSFSDKKTAKSQLADIKKQYKDCYLRRL